MYSYIVRSTDAFILPVSSSARAAAATYHPKGYGVSEGLLRARKPFRTGNAIIGLTITTFAFSVYFYSIRAVAQDDFSDVEAPSQAERAGVQSIEDELKLKKALKEERLSFPSAILAPGVVDAAESKLADKLESVAPAASWRSSSILSQLKGAFGGRGTGSKLFVGAPDVDRIGRLAMHRW